MKLLAPAHLHERLRLRGAQLERLAVALANGTAVWRMRLKQHRLALAAVGGGIAGATFAMRWRSLLRLVVLVTGGLVRAAAASAMAHARVERAVREHEFRASRTTHGM